MPIPCVLDSVPEREQVLPKCFSIRESQARPIPAQSPAPLGQTTTTCTGVAGRKMSSLIKALEDPRMKGLKIQRTTAMSEPGRDWNFIDAVGRNLL